MEDGAVFRLAVRAGIPLSAVFLLSLLKLSAPYGRHHASSPLAGSALGRGNRLLPPRLAWAIMESPALILTPLLFTLGRASGQALPRALLALFLLHYAHRVLVFPLRIRPSARHMPLSVILSSLFFNTYNAYIQARSLSHYAPPSGSLVRHASGALLFLSGMWINIWSDSVLINLRRLKSVGDGAKVYSIPRGGLFELVSCPNYLGEILEWTAWAVLTRSAAGFAFLLLTVGNLLPRALAHHRWYRAKFPQYPRSRRALIPFVL